LIVSVVSSEALLVFFLLFSVVSSEALLVFFPLFPKLVTCEAVTSVFVLLLFDFFFDEPVPKLVTCEAVISVFLPLDFFDAPPADCTCDCRLNFFFLSRLAFVFVFFLLAFVFVFVLVAALTLAALGRIGPLAALIGIIRRLTALIVITWRLAALFCIIGTLIAALGVTLGTLGRGSALGIFGPLGRTIWSLWALKKDCPKTWGGAIMTVMRNENKLFKFIVSRLFFCFTSFFSLLNPIANTWTLISEIAVLETVCTVCIYVRVYVCRLRRYVLQRNE